MPWYGWLIYGGLFGVASMLTRRRPAVEAWIICVLVFSTGPLFFVLLCDASSLAGRSVVAVLGDAFVAGLILGTAAQILTFLAHRFVSWGGRLLRISKTPRVPK